MHTTHDTTRKVDTLPDDQRAYERMNITGLFHACGKLPTLAELLAHCDRHAAERHGTDGVLDSAMHLCVEEFEVLESRVKLLRKKQSRSWVPA